MKINFKTYNYHLLNLLINSALTKHKNNKIPCDLTIPVYVDCRSLKKYEEHRLH